MPPAKATARRVQPQPGQPAEPSSVSVPARVPGLHQLAGLRAAMVVFTLDALGLLGGGIYLAIRSTGHDATNHKAAVSQAVFALIGALIFGALALGARPRRPSIAIRTPGTILELIFIPVSIGLFQSGRPGIGGPLLLSALIALAGLVLGFQMRNTDL